MATTFNSGEWGFSRSLPELFQKEYSRLLVLLQILVPEVFLCSSLAPHLIAISNA
jgi:hypothetical protein